MLCYRPMEERKKRLIVHAMKNEGIQAEDLCYMAGDDGREAIVLTMSTDRKIGIPAEEVADMISVLLNRRLELP